MVTPRKVKDYRVPVAFEENMDIKQMITGEEPTEETVHITTEDEDNYEEEEKGFNDQVKARH